MQAPAQAVRHRRPNPEHGRAVPVGYGYSWCAVGSDMSMMVGRAQEWLGKLRGTTATAPKAQGPTDRKQRVGCSRTHKARR